MGRMGGDVLRARLKSIFRLRLDDLRYGTSPAQRTGIGGIIGVDIKCGVARVAGCHMGCKKRGLSPRRDKHILRSRGDTCARVDPRGHRFAQRFGAGNGGIARVSAHRGAVHLLQDRGRRADVVFADGKFCDANACGNHLACFQKDVPTVRSAAGKACDAL